VLSTECQPRTLRVMFATTSLVLSLLTSHLTCPSLPLFLLCPYSGLTSSCSSFTICNDTYSNKSWCIVTQGMFVLLDGAGDVLLLPHLPHSTHPSFHPGHISYSGSRLTSLCSPPCSPKHFPVPAHPLTPFPSPTLTCSSHSSSPPPSLLPSALNSLSLSLSLWPPSQAL
jgi:hypothetical protein